MRLLLIRHGEPDAPRDALTEVGKIEAGMLADYLVEDTLDELYVSPLVRAQQTAAPYLEKTGRTAQMLPWLQEFTVPIMRPDRTEVINIPWDWPPQVWLSDPRFLDPFHWHENEVFQQAHVRERYDEVVTEFDALLAAHGYVRDGLWYRAEKPNKDTLAFFCHLGLSCVLLSHLMNVSPMVLWHGTTLLPSSITTVYTEERRAGIASFRASAIGDTSHLALQGQKPSFAARFCEVYGDGTRVD